MKKLIPILIYPLLFMVMHISMFSQIFKNDFGYVDNKGRIRIKGQATFKQDTIGGRVEYINFDQNSIQYVPEIVYNDIYLGGLNKKYLLDTTKNLTALTNIQTEGNVFIKLAQKTSILSLGTTNHNATINPDEIFGMFRLVGNTAQNTFGRGIFKELELNNPAGTDITDGGGFHVSTRLELMRGSLRNSKGNNLIMDNSSLIVRNYGSTIANPPEFGSSVSVKYIGDGPILTGPEIHCDSLVLQNLMVQNTGGLTLDTNITANNSLTLASMLYTEPDSIRRYTLTYNSPLSPQFINDTMEIDGSLKRTSLKIGEPIIFNNLHTYAYFYDSTSKDGTTSLTMRIKPHQFPQPPLLYGNTKVKRNFYIQAQDKDGHNPSGINMRFGYAWRWSQTDPNTDETNNLSVPDLKLQYYFGVNWVNVDSSKVPIIDKQNGWAYSYADVVTPNHDFAIGLSFMDRMILTLKVLLEGPFRGGSMAADLRVKNLIPKSPDDIYPYNLDLNRQNYKVASIPDSIVDWIVLEFRQLPSVSIGKYKTAFLKRDGSIVDTDGYKPIYLTRTSLDTGNYYVIVRHRNHLAVMTQFPLHLQPKSSPISLDFSRPDNDLSLAGLKNYLKPIYLDSDNKMHWAMIAGDINGDGKITQADIDIYKADYLDLFDVLVNNSNFTADYSKYSRYDLSMGGKINTRDWNYVWNNRGKTSNVP
jgi:hypothetical protein